MIVPDLNLVLYAHFDAFAQHAAARAWWEGLLNGRTEVGIGAPVWSGFLRLATNRRVLDSPMSVEDAVANVEGWLQRRHVRVLHPGPRHLEVAFALLRRLGTAANLTTDAQLAALAIEHQGELHSNDADFGRFPRLRWVNPLE
ncbi:MAG TPA: TA system VapC family ribonuclease toxin [Polyangia bacterium]|nr:TA system VapC family ribonuclease toxin [Polyangia bacterium]